ncbi:hypothetical protein QT974_33455, partial [Microcoleus sp. herbarium12]
MNQARRQAYLILIESLLTCPSEEKTAILQANLELLDDEFAEYLREWATETLPNLDASQAYSFASNIYNINYIIGDFPLGSRASNLEIAIACDDIVLMVWTKDIYPEKWAQIQNSRAIDYTNRIKGDRGDNLEKAIGFY